MDEEIAIIDANTRYQKIQNFFINNKKKLIITFVLFISILFGYFIYESQIKKNKIKLANQYSKATINFASNNNENVKISLIELVHKKDKTYSPLALYFLIDNDILTEKKEMNDLFNSLIEETKLEEEIINLIIYKKALFNSEYASENELLNILNPLIKSDSVWKSHALHLMGEFLISKKENLKAKEFFEKILTLENSNLSIKLDAKKRLQRDFGEK